MTNVFKFDFGPTRAPPIGMPNLNLPGSFSTAFDGLIYQGMNLINWAGANWVNIGVLAFAVYGGILGVPRLLEHGAKWTKRLIRNTKKWL